MNNFIDSIIRPIAKLSSACVILALAVTFIMKGGFQLPTKAPAIDLSLDPNKVIGEPIVKAFVFPAGKPGKEDKLNGVKVGDTIEVKVQFANNTNKTLYGVHLGCSGSEGCFELVEGSTKIYTGDGEKSKTSADIISPEGLELGSFDGFSNADYRNGRGANIYVKFQLECLVAPSSETTTMVSLTLWSTSPDWETTIADTVYVNIEPGPTTTSDVAATSAAATTAAVSAALASMS